MSNGDWLKTILFSQAGYINIPRPQAWWTEPGYSGNSCNSAVFTIENEDYDVTAYRDKTEVPNTRLSC